MNYERMAANEGYASGYDDGRHNLPYDDAVCRSGCAYDISDLEDLYAHYYERGYIQGQIKAGYQPSRSS